jgi:TRAP-type C4-dicarboxylate transport system permease small subunit
MKKRLMYILTYIMLIILFILFMGFAWNIIMQTGNAYRIMFLELGLKDMVISFIIGLVFYVIMFYGLYRLDFKIRNKINKTNRNDVKEVI